MSFKYLTKLMHCVNTGHIASTVNYLIPTAFG